MSNLDLVDVSPLVKVFRLVGGPPVLFFVGSRRVFHGEKLPAHGQSVLVNFID